MTGYQKEYRNTGQKFESTKEKNELEMSEDDDNATMFAMLRIEASKTKENHPTLVMAAPKQKQPQPTND